MDLKKLYGGKEETKITSVYSQKRNAARESLIRAVAKTFSKQFGFKNNFNASLEEVVRDMRSKLPIKEHSKLSNKPDVLHKSCIEIGKVFNQYLGSDFIDLKSSDLCQEISDNIYSLSVQVNGE